MTAGERLRIGITVAAFLQAPDFGGPVTKVALLAEALAARGHDVTVLTADYGPARSRVPAETTTVDGYAVHYLRSIARYRWSPMLAPGALAGVEWDFDVVHVCGLRDGLGWSVTRRAQRRHVPYVLEPMGMAPARLRSARLKAVYDRLVTAGQIAGAARLVATSETERSLLAAQYPSARIDVRPNPLAARDGAVRKVRHRAAPFDVLFVGRICRTKGLTNLLEAARSLDNVRVTIAGPDDNDGTREALHTIATTLPPGRIVMRGWVSADERDALIAAADVCVLPSLTENFGNFAVEAARGRRPVVVTRTSGVAEFLDGAALVVSPDAAELRDAISALADDPVRADKLADAAYERVRDLEPATVAAMQERIYFDALGRR